MDLSARQGDVAGENYHNEGVNLTKCNIKVEIGGDAARMIRRS